MGTDLTKVDEILGGHPRAESSLVLVLQDIQSRFRFLPCEALERVASELDIPTSRVFSVATFYKAFSLEPQGRTLIQVCKGTACHVRGATLLEEELSRQLEIPVGGTTEEGAFTLKVVNCVGACALAPVVVVGEQYNSDVKPVHVKRLLRRATRMARDEAPVRSARQTSDLEEHARFDSPERLLARARRAQKTLAGLQQVVSVCGGPGCLAAGADRVHDSIRRAAAASETLVTLTGCQGLCEQGPLVHVSPDDTLYTRVAPTDAEAIVEALQQGTRVESLLGDCPTRSEHPFYRGQETRALAFCGRVDPESLDAYLALGGFAGLAKALAEMTPEQVLDAVEAAGLRGRGGAGFPTARKWRTALRAARAGGSAPYVLCNGDEGDPGAFMDRAIMEGAPFAVIEGMILGSYALGAREGVIYVRAEYPLAVERLQLAIDTCRRVGLLGDEILGSAHSFDIRISRGGGAFVCGESTALMRSIEGKVGEPRAKYIRSAERGLYDRPTVLNNVETWVLVPGVVRHGADWLRALGTDRSKGTKVFSLVGQVRRTGLVEVPMGTTLRTLIFEIGGGMRGGRRFKAVQTGGPSGGCLPESCLDLPIDFEVLEEAGSMMGSGGMIVMGNDTCMVDLARYFVDFLQEESCGKCVPCRLGLPQLSFLLDKVIRGVASSADLDAIADVSKGMAGSSLCGLGKSAPNPVLSTLRYFRDEYEAHLRRVCPAGVCRALIRYQITAQCPGCLACLEPCPNDAIRGEKQEVHVIDQELCDQCGICHSVCKLEAVQIVSDGGLVS